MNETDMIPHIIEIFWIEKLRFTQYCFQQIGRISDAEYDSSDQSRSKSIAWAIEQMAAFDRNFAFSRIYLRLYAPCLGICHLSIKIVACKASA